MPTNRAPNDFFPCPHCGADVPRGAAACRACGSDSETGWSEDAGVWQTDLPAGYAEDEDFDYEQYVSREFSDACSTKAKFKSLATVLIVVLVCLGLLLISVLGI